MEKAVRPKLGELMLAAGLLDETSLEQLLSLHAQQRVPLGMVAVHEGAVSVLQMHQLLAQQLDVSFVDLTLYPPEKEVMNRRDITNYLRYRYVPLRRDDDGVLHIAACDMSQQMCAWFAQRYGERIGVVMTSPRDILRAVEHHYSRYLARLARTRLHKQLPDKCAYRQRKLTFPALVVALVLVLCVVLVVLWSQARALAVLVGVVNLCYVVAVSFKCMLLYGGAKALQQNTDMPVWTKPEAELPVYSVLVPLYKEAQSVHALLDALQALDYPKSKLDIKLIVEQEDMQTLQAVLQARPMAMVDVIVVPDMPPRTKPKACNYAMSFVRGEFVVIYDAEDRPEADQLKKAVAAFAVASPDVACFQAELGYYNRDDNLLSRWFSLEYGMLFGLLLGGLARWKMPVPLGGTSNHFRVDVLRQLGEWDAYNVTEDADVGIRLATHGYRTCMLHSRTWEESPISLVVWLRQRSRWIKGYLQTWAVHMRDPVMLYRQLGASGFVGFQLFFALSTCVYVFAPLLWGVVLWHWIDAQQVFTEYLAIGVLICGWIVQWLGAVMTLRHVPRCQRGGWQMLYATLTFPLYGLLHSVASFKAVWQFIRKPYYWEKTPHGLFKRKGADNALIT
jgi:glycosyltransferase XagB